MSEITLANEAASPAERAAHPGSARRMMTALGGTWRWFGLAVVLVAFCGLSGLTLLELRRDAWQQATTSANNLLAVLTRDIARNFEIYDGGLERIAGLVGNSEFTALPPRLQHKILFEGAFVDRYFSNLLVLDRNGNIVRDRDSTIPRSANLADQDYFRVQKENLEAGLYVSRPLTQRVLGSDDVLVLSRRLEAADGSFAGVAVGTVRLSLFRDLFAEAHLRPNDVLSVLSSRGVMIMRQPEVAGVIGRDLSGTPNTGHFLQEASGTFRGTSAIDGVHRVYSFDRVPGYPLILVVALSEDDIFVLWDRLALGIGTALAGLCILTVAIAASMRRELRRRKSAEESIRRSEARFRLLADNTTDVILRLNESRQRDYISPASLVLLGYRPEDLLGRQSQELIHPDDLSIVDETVARARRRKGEAEAIYRLRHAQGHYVWVEGRYNYVAQDRAFIVVLRDISRRKEAERRLAEAHAELSALANTDGLTGLANRRRFDEAILVECAPGRASRPVSLLLFDIDRFKLFNDRYGHPAGDECLRQVAGAVRDALDGETALAARYGGEEFAVLLPDMEGEDAERIAERVRAAIAARMLPHEGNQANGGVVTVSVGQATSRIEVQAEAERQAARLVAEADRLLYEAKRLGRNRVVSEASLGVDARLLEALEHGRIDDFMQFMRAGEELSGTNLDSIAASAAKLLDAPIGMVSLIGEDTAHFVGRHGADIVAFPRANSFCNHTIQGRDPLVVADLSGDRRFLGNPLVAGETALRFYAGAPLFHPETGKAVGAVCVLDFKPRTDFDEGKRRMLTALSSIATTQFAAKI